MAAIFPFFSVFIYFLFVFGTRLDRHLFLMRETSNILPARSLAF
uniref:Uncharacterized protein n=1 Tax=Rhizophora mucronata TaxID=61149 RepID=A0A2P2NW91_RHIMU